MARVTSVMARVTIDVEEAVAARIDALENLLPNFPEWWDMSCAVCNLVDRGDEGDLMIAEGIARYLRRLQDAGIIEGVPPEVLAVAAES